MRLSSESLISDGNTLLSSTNTQIKTVLAKVKYADENDDIEKEDEGDLDDKSED
jgi:hypothetical protein